MAACNLLYTSNQGNKVGIKVDLKYYLKNAGNDVGTGIGNFINKYVRYNSSNQQVKLVPSSTDSESDMDKSLRALYSDLKNVVQSASFIDANTAEQILSRFRDAMSIIDNSQEARVFSEEELLPQKELEDRNTRNLQRHLDDFYGRDALNITEGMRLDFTDRIAAAAYYNITTGRLVRQDNVQLNQRILAQKERLFEDIVHYLQRTYGSDQTVMKLSDKLIKDGEIDMDNYNVAMNKFYALEVAPDPDSFKKKLQKDNADEIRGEARKNRKRAYESLVDKMLKDDKFAEHAKRKYGKTYGLAQLRTQLYVGDHYSQYYGFIQEYINKSMESSDPNVVAQAREWNRKLKDIDQSTQSLLDIANAYTMLRHFDSLLKDTGGKQISIKRGLQGINTSVPDKYSYSHDTEHERKDWSTSEKIGSEKHTSKLTEAVLKLIRIYDWRTGEFMNRRVDPTVFIMSVQKLRDALINGSLTFHGNEKAAKEIREVAINLMDDPIGNMQRLLELLFEKQGHARESLAKTRGIKGSSYYKLTDLDLSILKSIYDTVFNKNNEYSFYMQSIRAGIWDPAAQSLLREIAGYAIRNNTIDYLETDYDVDTGTPNVVRKKKFFTNRPLRMLQVRINNHLNRKSDLAREYLQNEYNAASASDPNDGKRTIYTVNVKGMNLKLSIPNSNSYQILAIDYSNESAVEFTIDGKQSLFADIDKIDLSEFRMKVNENKTLNTNEQLLYNLLKFIDDNLNMGILNDIGLQTLYTFKQIYQKIDNQPYYIMPLLKLAMRAAYANSKYYEAQEETLGHYLDKTNDSVYKYHQGTIGSRVFTNRFNDVKYRIASYRDKVLEMWIDAASILNGDASKSTTKDRQGNTIPNNTVSKLGSNLAYYLGKQRRNIGDASARLMFTSERNSGMLKGTYHDLEITSLRGDTKSIRQLSVGELVYHAIFNKFYGPWNSRKTLIIQPTVYSDKTTYMNWEIDPTAWEDSDGNDHNLMEIPIIDITGESTSLIDVHIATLGRFYRSIHETTTAKLDAIAKAYVQSHQELKNSSTRDILATMSENDLVKTAASIGQEVELNKDYVIVKRNGRNVVAMNGMLEYNSKLYNDRDMLIKHLRGQETAFVGQLLDNGCAYQVLTGNDTLDMYTGDKQISNQARSKNPILRTILETQSTDRAKYMGKWVDADTGKLILAKQDGHNILSLSDAFDRSRDVELNPLLQRFFHVESLLSNNLRMSLTGSEVNHPPRKGKNVLTSASAANTISEWNSLGIGMTFDAENAEDVIAFAQLHNEEKTGLLDNDKVLTIDDLNVLMAKANSYTPRVREALTALRDSLGQFIANTSQGTQFKRNVIIPATLQYCVQQDKEGPPPQVRCAVIRDEGAPVWNYRGDHESDIDACDGNAKITAWQCIMENRSLGSQSVGFVKKPIWHSYDTKGGTAFLAKFATDTLTNELMRTSLLSKTNLYNLFKKATNLQWDPSDNIDLTKGIDRVEGYEEGVKSDENDEKLAKSIHGLWFKSMILGSQRLFYKDKYGDIKEIVDLGKSTSTVGEGQGVYYYTVETDAARNRTKKYHLFYDEGSGVAGKSIHLTFDTLPQLLRMRSQLAAEGKNPHTINSLFELYTALGGLNCVDKDGNDSEYNNEVMVNFMCNIGGLKTDVKQADVEFTSQKTHDQPLKKYHIGYMFNATAVKNGAKNINSSEAWSNDEELSTFMVDFDGFGIQMNADHEIIDSELTEFSQVVAACAAYGYTFNNCRELFHSLAQTALQASKAMIDATDAFLAEINGNDKAKVISDLYDAVGRIFFMEHVIKDRQSLENIIIQGVRKVFDKNSNHTHDSKKMPFSDPNIYNTFISTLASTITKRSIKRKHPGSGSVMVPAYNMMQYFEVANDKGQIEKIFAPTLLERARSDYRNDVLKFLESQEGYDKESYYLTIGNKKYPVIPSGSLDKLVKLAIKIDPTGSFSDYYNDIEDATTSNQMLMRTYLGKNAPKHEIVTDAEYFMPSDSVDVLDEGGNVVETITLDSMDKYLNFLDRADTGGFGINRFRISATTPQNLKPSLIRWKYKDKNGQVRTMNYFALKHVRDAYMSEDPNYTKTRAYRKQVQDVLQGLHEGHFTGNDGVEYTIIPGTLENMEAELVMGNIYKDTFGIGNESLNEVMAKGESYFHDKMSRLAAPKNINYDIAFLREKGSHTLISLSPVEEGRLIDENPFTNTMTTKEGEIYAVKNGRQLFKIGKWVNIDPEKDGISYEASTQKFLSDKGVNIDQSQYRIYNGQEGNTVVQKRVDFVKRYRMLIKKPLSGGGVSYETNTLYEMASLEDIMSAFSDNPRMRDAIKQRSAIITAIYKASDYKMVQVNDLKALTMPEKIKSKDLHNALDYLADGDDFDDNNRALIHSQIHGIEELEKIGKPTEEQRNKYLKEVEHNKKEFLGKEAHRQWVSFQDSVKFIAARIPAQSLQSFMAMRLVGWTGNNMNMCYVSHFQTYLQGSDYDIDKAYVMGQNYDSNGIYVKWSPLFDYTSLQTLEASKKLPVPKDLNVQRMDLQGADITNLQGANMTGEIIELSKLTTELKEHGNQKLSTKGKKEEDKVKFLNIMCNVLRKLEDNGGKWYFDHRSEEAKGISDQFLKAFETTLIRHEHYQAPESVAEESSKNAASANIYAVAHDIRNRDQAYTAVTMNDYRRAAEHTPKGEQSAALSMTNPLTKYIMQYQFMAGKSVVGIAANGEKFWFNAYYYCTDALINRPDSELRYLKFAHTFNMIKGRAKGTKFDPELAENTVNHLPDLDIRNEKIRQRLLDVFGVDPDSEIPHYVDQLISQLLSAATDNAKELILAKLNADANFAKMYLYLMTMGEDVNDIAAFMTSPLAEFVASRAASNIFQGDAVFNTPNTAIQAALGKVYANNFIHGRMYVPDPSLDANENDVVSRAKTVVVRSVFMDNLRVRGKEAIDMISRYLELEENDILEKQDLDDLMGALIICSLRSPETFSKGGEAFSIKNFMGKMNDVEMNNYITYCQDLYNQLSNVISQYEKQLEKLEPIDPITKEKKTIPSTRSDAVNYYLRDVDNFKRAYELSDEMSNISVGLLKLNQGLPSSELEFLQRLSQIKRIITSREKALGIKTDCFNEKLNEDSRTRALNKMLDAIIENNPLLLEGVREDDPEGIQAVRDQITSVLERANKAGMMGGGFESIRMLIDDDYRNLAREYLHYIKGTFNAIDMVYNIPHYASIMNCFKAFAVANSALVAKSRLIDRLTADEDYLNDAKLKGAIRYVDKLNAVDFLAQQDPFIPHKSVMGFDAFFADKMVDSFDLSTAEGLASFRKFMETDFLDYLREKYPNNSLVPHLMLTEQSGGTLLSTDTDLMNPDATAASKIAFQEILTGMSDFAKIKYENSDLTIADVFQLYNIMMNGDQYGAERLTVTFQAGMNANCILQKYHDFLSRQDSNPGYISDYERFDYYINAAPLITARAESMHSEPFVKVKDPVWDYIVKIRNSTGGGYSEYPMMQALPDRKIDPIEQNRRRANFIEYCPVEMPVKLKNLSVLGTLNFDKNTDNVDIENEELLKKIEVLLTDMTMSNKAVLYKEC